MDRSCLHLILFIFITSCCIWNGKGKAQPRTMQTMEWKFSRKLYEYRSYGAITLERIDIPLHTIFANITLNAFSTSGSCPDKNVKIFTKQFGIPVISRDNETFPTHTSLPKETQNISLTTNNQTKVWILKELQKGSLFVLAIFPNLDTRIRQKGLSEECNYFITIQAKMYHYREESVLMLPLNEEFKLISFSNTIAGFRLPMDTLSYSIKLQGNQDISTVNVLILESLGPDIWTSNKTDCVWKNKTCLIQKSSARVNSINYLLLSSTMQESFTFNFKLTLNICEEVTLNNTTAAGLLPKQDLHYRFVAELSRETPSDENQGSNFFDRFAIMDRKTSLPLKIISVHIPDVFIAVMRLKLWTSDTGSSLNVILHSPVMKGDQDAKVNVCVSPYRILNASSCAEGSMLTMNTRTKEEQAKLLFPYPESGVWYFSLQSSCFNKSSNKTVTCTDYPLVNMTINMASCVEGKCGKFGSCKLYTSADILYSACDCHDGWRGYGCNDGTKAASDFDEKLTVYLLTLSNLGFIPGIIFAIRRRFFVEALIYAYNMFFSTFYHACDSSSVYQLCIMPYNALSFADFFASLLSFAVTLLAMARISSGFRSFLHMLMALFISLGEVYNRHGLIENLFPILGGVAIVILTWSYECYKRKVLFPSKRRYLKFILPGLLLASLGLILNLAISTEENYKYVHSIWHILESTAIVFLLPPGRCQKDQVNTGLSVQSGDVSLPCENINLVNENGASLHNAGDISPTQTGSSSSLRQTPSLRERFSRMIGPRRPRQNFVL